MAIKSNLNEINQLNENVQKKNNLQAILGDTLFWLTKPLNNRLIVDGWMVNQLDNVKEGVTFDTQIKGITSQIGQKRTWSAPKVPYTVSKLKETIDTIKMVEAEKESEKRETERNERMMNSLAKPQKGDNRDDYNAKISAYEKSIKASAENINEYERVLPLLKELQSLQELDSFYGPTIKNRIWEVDKTKEILEKFEFGWVIDNMINEGEKRPYTIGEPSKDNSKKQDLGKWHFLKDNVDDDTLKKIEYTLCDNETGDPLSIENGIMQVKVGDKTVWVRGIKINKDKQIELENIQIEELAGINFPINLQFAIRWRIQSPNGINLDHFKTFNLTLNKPSLLLTDREAAYDELNTEDDKAIDKRLIAEYSDPTRTNLENEVIWEILRANGNQTEIDKIYNDPQQRDILIQRIRTIPDFIPVFETRNLLTGFKIEMTKDTRNVPVQYLVSKQAFTDYLRLNMTENVKTYVKTQIKNEINNSADRNNVLKMVMNFQADIINDKLDNNDHMVLDREIPKNSPQWHPNTRWQRLLKIRSNRNNWTKFMDGRESKSFNDTLETEKGQLGFDIKVAVQGVNKIVTTINIKGEDEPIILDTKDVNEMTHMILRLEATKTGEPINNKLRCRMALNAVKAVVSMAPTTLHREYNGNITGIDGKPHKVDRISAFIRWENLQIRGSCADHDNRQRVNHVIFDEQRYKWLHNINELQRGMVALSTQVNDIMNAMGSEFRHATSHIKATPLMNYGTNNYLRGGPVKRLRGRMFYGKTNWKFDFDTTATSWSKTVNIKHEKGLFILSGTFKGKPYEFKGRDLGKLIRKKIDRLRVFDGLEFAMFEKINEAKITQLRSNNFISPENFWVSDISKDKTGRVFIMDKEGDLSYIEIEDRKLDPLHGKKSGRIPFNDMPPQRIRCNETERREFMQNPELSNRLINAMKGRLRLF
jgi:hypothetical protein